MCGYMYHEFSAPKVYMKASDPSETDLQEAVNCPTWAQGSKFRSPTRAEQVLFSNCDSNLRAYSNQIT